MSVISRLFGNREDSSEAVVHDKQVEEVIETTASAPVQEEVTPEVVANVQEKQGFESLTGRIFLHREGDSTGKTWLVRVLAVLLLPFTILTAIFDAGRFAAYKAGLINGQSYSLIDMTSDAVQSAAAKVKSVYNSYMHPVKTIEQENEETLRQMQKLSKELVDAYDALNASHFSHPQALKAAQRIPEIQQRLINEINAYVARNATSTEDFAERLHMARAMVAQQITEAAGTRVYIANKVERLGPPASLASVIVAEFNTAFESNRPMISAIFTQIARQGADVIAGLKSGIESGVITSEQAKEAVAEHAVTVFNQGLEEGLKTADQVTEAFVREAAKQGLVSEVEADVAAMGATADVSDLAAAAARDIARTITEATSEQEIDHMLAKAAEKLIAQGRLSEEDESQFLAEAKSLVQAAKEQIEAERQAQIALEREQAELQAAQDAEAAQQVELAKMQGVLLGSFVDFLNLISDKQRALVELHGKHDALKEELRLARIEYLNLQNRTTQINGEEVSLLRAAQIYHAEVARITGLDVTDAERQRQLEELAAQGFDRNTVEIINQLTSFTTDTIMPIILRMSEVADQITVLHDEVKHNLAVYNVFRTNNINVLEKAQKQEVVAQEKPVLLLQKRLDVQHDKLLRIPYIQRMRGRKTVVETDAELNRAEVARLLEAYNQPGAPEVLATVNPEPNTLRYVVTYPFNKVSEILGYLFGSTPQPQVQGEPEVVEEVEV